MDSIQRTNSYIYACSDLREEESAPLPIAGNKLRFGDRELSKLDLDQFGIKCGYGRIGHPVGHGAFACVYDFYLDRPDGSRPSTPDTVEWVFKPEFPHEQASFEEKTPAFRQYPLTDNGWLHGTIRSITSYQVARALGIDNVVETHLGFADNTPGALMRKIHGETVVDWLINRRFYEQTGLSCGYPKEELSRLIHSTAAKDKQLFKKILWQAFQKAINEAGLTEDWAQLKCVDFITGQADRNKLSNMMVSVQRGRLRLTGIDNDLSFPVNNAHLDPVIPRKACVIPSVNNPELCRRMVSVLHPDALEAYLARASVVQPFWFIEKGEDEPGSGAEAAPEGFDSASGSGARNNSQPVQGGAPNRVLFEEMPTVSDRRCIIL